MTRSRAMTLAITFVWIILLLFVSPTTRGFQACENGDARCPEEVRR